MNKRMYRLADGRLATVEQTPRGIVVRDRHGNVITATTQSL